MIRRQQAGPGKEGRHGATACHRLGVRLGPSGSGLVGNPYPIWQTLRDGCPVAHTERYRGVYFPTRYSEIREVAYNPDRFSSRRVVVREGDYRVNSPPITADPPEHRALRMVLIPPFTPQAVAKLEPQTRRVCNELIDRIVSQSTCDGAADYAQHIPVQIIAHMLGIPAEHGDQFRSWITMALQEGITNQAALKQAEQEISDYFVKQIGKRREQAGDDLVSFLINARQPGGEPFSDRQVLGALRLLLVAGIDTTWSAIGSSLWHLATHQGDRERLVHEPELIASAIEEFCVLTHRSRWRAKSSRTPSSPAVRCASTKWSCSRFLPPTAIQTSSQMRIP